MNRYRVRFTAGAEDDLLRLYDFPIEKDLDAAEHALTAIRPGIELFGLSPFTCRKAVAGKPLLRELVIPFGAAGYVALFEIEGPSIVTILALRHQREEDYH